MRWSAVFLAIVLATAGCLTPGTDDDTDDTELPDDDAGPQTTWQSVERSGTVSGVGTPAGSVSQGGGNTATWTVEEDTRVLYMNVTTEGGELSIEYGPNCETEDTVSCDYQASTEDGAVSEVHETPETGGWEAYFFLENDAGEVDWELVVTMGVLES